MEKCIGVLTAGGDSPGLNAAIRALGKAAGYKYDMHVIGIKDGFRGLMENRLMRLPASELSNILTHGGTILGTSRDKPHRMPVGNKIMDMTDVMVDACIQHHIDCLVCIGGGGTHKNAFRLMEKGLNVVTIPKTIDNDIAMTDCTIGFDTALNIATEAIDRLHSTAHSHHRIIVVEIMGHNAGWLTLGAGVAGGADVILIPEIPYDINQVANAINKRRKEGKHFSIVAVAEGAVAKEEADEVMLALKLKEEAKKKKDIKSAEEKINKIRAKHVDHTLNIAKQLEKLTKLESRVTILGYLQRGGSPSPADRLLATRLGTACAELIEKGKYGFMVAAKGDGTEPVPLDKVVGKRKTVNIDHPWILSAKDLGTCFGD